MKRSELVDLLNKLPDLQVVYPNETRPNVFKLFDIDKVEEIKTMFPPGLSAFSLADMKEEKIIIIH